VPSIHRLFECRVSELRPCAQATKAFINTVLKFQRGDAHPLSSLRSQLPVAREALDARRRLRAPAACARLSGARMRCSRRKRCERSTISPARASDGEQTGKWNNYLGVHSDLARVVVAKTTCHPISLVASAAAFHWPSGLRDPLEWTRSTV